MHDTDFLHEHSELTEADRAEIARYIWSQETVELKTVGIDIGSYSIKVAEIESNLKSATVRDFYEIELTHELGQDLRLEKLEAIRRIANQYDPSTYRIIVGMGSEFSSQSE